MNKTIPDEDDFSSFLLTLFFLILLGVVGFLMGYVIGHKEYESLRDEAIQVGVGQYNAQTAEFEWVTNRLTTTDKKIEKSVD